jgi:hypothetical protein
MSRIPATPDPARRSWNRCHGALIAGLSSLGLVTYPSRSLMCHADANPKRPRMGLKINDRRKRYSSHAKSLAPVSWVAAGIWSIASRSVSWVAANELEQAPPSTAIRCGFTTGAASSPRQKWRSDLRCLSGQVSALDRRPHASPNGRSQTHFKSRTTRNPLA